MSFVERPELIIPALRVLSTAIDVGGGATAEQRRLVEVLATAIWEMESPEPRSLAAITPAAVAHRIAELVPASTVVQLPNAAHSILDSHDEAALRIVSAVAGGREKSLPAQAGALDRLPAVASVRIARPALAAAARIAGALPRFS